jgi:predicted ArsR family transcriptional regulator
MPRSRQTDDIAAVGLLEEPLRRRLYDWVVGQPEPVGREQAARAVGVKRALATFHLDKLVAAGLLEGGYQRLTGRVGPGAGRPARVYSRAEREFSVSVPERRYHRAASLFASALERLGDGRLPPVLTDAARDLGESLGRAATRGGERTRLSRALEAGGYEPITDAHGTIRLRNCPYDALAEAHRSLVCGTNLALAEGLAAGAGVTELRPVLDPQPGLCCVAFVPNQPSASARATMMPSGPRT